MRNAINFIRSTCGLLLVFVCIVGLSSCSIKNVEYRRFENLRIDKISPVPELSMNIVLFNPNKIGCKVHKAFVIISSGNDTIGYAVSTQKVKLNAASEFAVPVNSQVALPLVLKLSGQMLFGKKDLPLQLNGDVTIKKFIFNKRIHFSVNEKIDTNFFTSHD